MKRLITIAGTVLVLVGLTVSVKADMLDITYTLTTGGGGGTYDYTVWNNSLSGPLTDFLIYFPDVQSPDAFNYVLNSAVNPAGWSSSLFQPSAIDLGGYVEWTALTAIAPGGALSGFGASFLYSGSATLGSQYFEVYDQDFNVLTSGWTTVIPEPSTCGLLTFLLAGMGVRGVLSNKKVLK
jgi:hypothetical protein